MLKEQRMPREYDPKKRTLFNSHQRKEVRENV